MKQSITVPLSEDHLAARWTEPTLQVLRAAGIPAITVDMELEAWRILKRVIRTILRWQRLYGHAIRVSIGTLKEQSLRKASLLVAQAFHPSLISQEFEQRIGQLAKPLESKAIHPGLTSASLRLPGALLAIPEGNRIQGR